jgi:hypothetical protein
MKDEPMHYASPEGIRAKMTQKEFIAMYAKASSLPVECVTHYGVEVYDIKSYALPCHCGDESCTRWAMVHEQSLGFHFEHFYHPDDQK